MSLLGEETMSTDLGGQRLIDSSVANGIAMVGWILFATGLPHFSF